MTLAKILITALCGCTSSFLGDYLYHLLPDKYASQVTPLMVGAPICIVLIYLMFYLLNLD